MTAKTIDTEIKNLHRMIVNVMQQTTLKEIQKLTGISSTHISHMKAGRKPISRRRNYIFKVAKSLGIECEDLEDKFTGLRPTIIKIITDSKRENYGERKEIHDLTGYSGRVISQIIDGSNKLNGNELIEVAKRFGL